MSKTWNEIKVDISEKWDSNPFRDHIIRTFVNVFKRPRFGISCQVIGDGVHKPYLQLKKDGFEFQLKVLDVRDKTSILVVDKESKPGTSIRRDFFFKSFTRSESPNLRRLAITIANKISMKHIYKTMQE